jgi:hypothetical protein
MSFYCLYDMLSMAPGPLYITRDSIWYARGDQSLPVNQAQLHRFGSLPEFLKAAFAHHKRARTELRLKAQLDAPDHLYFVFSSLIPYLRFLSTEDSAVLEQIPDFIGELAELSKRSEELRTVVSKDVGQLSHTNLDRLGDILRIPSVVRRGLVIPLERAPAQDNALEVVLEGVHYRADIARALDLGEVAQDLDNAVFDGQAPGRLGSGHPSADVRRLLQDVDRILATAKLANNKPYKLLYSDRLHQVQYSQGFTFVVRGPVRVGPDMAFLGVSLSGRSRREWLFSKPILCSNPEKFWRRDGIPSNHSICMGCMDQYDVLLGSHFSDAQSLLLWLDAALTVVSERGLLHRHRRMVDPRILSQRPRSRNRR